GRGNDGAVGIGLAVLGLGVLAVAIPLWATGHDKEPQTMNVNAIFYTFSTISQTLAGAIGLIGAFVVFRLQSLSEQIELDGGRVAPFVRVVRQNAQQQAEVEEIVALHREGRYGDILAKSEDLASDPNMGVERSRLSRHWRQRRSIISGFTWAFMLSAALIVFSVIMLMIADSVAGSILITVAAFVAGAIGLCA